MRYLDEHGRAAAMYGDATAWLRLRAAGCIITLQREQYILMHQADSEKALLALASAAYTSSPTSSAAAAGLLNSCSYSWCRASACSIFMSFSAQSVASSCFIQTFTSYPFIPTTGLCSKLMPGLRLPSPVITWNE